MLGHKAGGFRTTEIYAKYDPSYMSKASQAIDDSMREIQEKCDTQIILNDRANKTIPKVSENKGMVGDTRFELVTFSMSTKVKMSEINDLGVHWLAFVDLSMQRTGVLGLKCVPLA